MIKLFGMLSVLFIVAAVFSYPLVHAVAGDDEKDYSFYRISSAASAYFDDIRNGDSDNYIKSEDLTDKLAGENGENGYKNWANSGGFVGFLDEDYSHGLFGSIVSKLASATQSRSYLSFWELSEKGGYGLLLYANYGKALSELGFDQTAYESPSFDKIVRFILGGFMYLVYYACFAAERIITGMIKIIQVINPFQWFLPSPGNSDNFFEAELRTAISDSGSMQGILTSGISEYYYSIMSLFQTMGYLLLCISMVAIIFSIIVIGRTNMRSKILKFITRFVFVLVGVPILGLMFTSMMSTLQDDIDQNGLGSNRVIMSTFVDFGSWAKNARLALPAGTQIVVGSLENGTGTVDIGKSTGARTFATKINELGSKKLSDTGITGSWSDSDDPNGLVADSSNGFLQKDLDKENKKVRSDIKKKKSSFTNDFANDVEHADAILKRYMMNDFYHATDFETEYKAIISNSPDSKAIFEKIKEDGDYESYIDKKKLLYNSSEGGDYLHDGRMRAVYNSGSPQSFSYTSRNGDKGLSTLSMYNYLNTSFEPTSIVTYSEHKSTSKLVRHSHYSVTLIGGGSMMSFLYYMGSLTMLFCLAILSFFYAFGMLFGSIGKMIRIVSTVPWAVLGGMRAIIKVTTLTIMVIAEVIGTIIAYRVVTFTFISLSGIYEKPMQALFTGEKGLNIPIIGELIVYAVLLVGIIMNLYFMIVSLKVRKQMVKALNDWTGEILDKFFSFGEGQSAPASSMMGNTGGSSVLGSLGKAAASGAVMAGGHAMMNKMAGSKGSPGDMSPVSGGDSATDDDVGVSQGGNTEEFDKLSAGDAPLGLPDKGGDSGDNTGSPDSPNGPDGSPVSGLDKDMVETKALESKFDDPNVTSLGGLDDKQDDNNSADSGSDLANNTDNLAETPEYKPDINGNKAEDKSDTPNEPSAEDKVKGTAEAGVHGTKAAAHGAEAYAKFHSGDVAGTLKAGKDALNEAKQAKAGADKAGITDKVSATGGVGGISSAKGLSSSGSPTGSSSKTGGSKSVSGSSSVGGKQSAQNNGGKSSLQANGIAGSGSSVLAGSSSGSKTSVNNSSNISNNSSKSSSSVSNGGSNMTSNSMSKVGVSGANVKSENNNKVNAKVDNNDNSRSLSQSSVKPNNSTQNKVRASRPTGSMVNQAMADGKRANDNKVKSFAVVANKRVATSMVNTNRYTNIGVSIDKQAVKHTLSNPKFQKAAMGAVVGATVVHSAKKKKLEEKKKEKKSDYI